MEESTRKQRLVAGWVATGFGVLVIAIVVLHPENLRVPSWVAFPAVSTLFFGGCALIVGEYQRTKRWVIAPGVLAVLGLMTPALWVAFGPGPQSCSAFGPFLGGAVSDWICRGVFGFGAACCAVYLFFLLRRFHKRTLD
jgi:hypothetical protein